MDHTTNAHVPAETAQTVRKTYNTPTLTDFGSFAELTHGTFSGGGVDNTVYS
jgi:hypothetical protein